MGFYKVWRKGNTSTRRFIEADGKSSAKVKFANEAGLKSYEVDAVSISASEYEQAVQERRANLAALLRGDAMPLTAKGEEIKSAMEKEYGAKKGEQVFYASKNKGTITGVDSKLDVAVALARGDMSGKDFDKLKETMDKWIEEEKKEPEHRDDNTDDHVVTKAKMQEVANKYKKDAPGLLQAQLREWGWNPNTIKETMALHKSVYMRDDASIKAKTEKVSKQGSSEQAKRIANDLKGARKECFVDKLDAAVVLSDAGASLAEVKRRAKEQSKKGYVQHVNEVYPGVYKIEDWYDSEQTICSYENGHEK